MAEAPLTLPEPGEIIVIDCRPSSSWTPQKYSTQSSSSSSPSPSSSSTSTSHPIPLTKTLKCLQWNVERNYCPSLILSTLKELDPDIAFIQEIDIDCKRSGNRDHFTEIAANMKWKGGFVCEFIEIESEKRHDRDQGGGVHGNAIFSKYDVDFRVLDHKHQPFNWEKDCDKLNEPRKGRRVTLVAEIKTAFGPPILCYCVHLEVFCGLIGRVNQFSEILSDSVIHASTHPYQLILGDLNTKSHSIARLSSFSRDRYCVLSLGMSESEWWDKNLLSWHACSGDTNMYLKYGGIWPVFALARWWVGDKKNAKNNDNGASAGGVGVDVGVDGVDVGVDVGVGVGSSGNYNDNENRTALSGFTPKVLTDARNPGFYDPWHPFYDVTINYPRYYALYSAKLDWTLVRGFNVIKRWIGNDDYSASDHKYLMIEVVFDDYSIASDTEGMAWEVWRMRRKEWKKRLEKEVESKRVRGSKGRVVQWIGFVAVFVAIGIGVARKRL